MITYTRWTPDTCTCTVDYSWDTEVDPRLRTHTYHTTIRTCPDHSGLSGAALYDALSDQNKRKNITIGFARTARANLDVRAMDFTFTGEDADRVLHISFPRTTLSPSEKTSIQNDCDTRFGAGKVAVT